MVEKLEQQNEHPALKGFSPTLEGIKYTVKSTIKTALKSALIGGAVLAAASLPFAVGAFGVELLPWVGKAAEGMTLHVITTSAMTGALAGLGIGAAVGAVTGLNGAEDAVEEEAQMRMAKANRQEQTKMRQKMFEQSLAMGAPTAGMGMTAGMQPSPGLLPMGAPAPGAGMGMGGGRTA